MDELFGLLILLFFIMAITPRSRTVVFVRPEPDTESPTDRGFRPEPPTDLPNVSSPPPPPGAST